MVFESRAGTSKGCARARNCNLRRQVRGRVFSLFVIMKSTTQEYKQRATSNVEEYDLLILGSRTAGKLLSSTLSKAGMKTVITERKSVGGFWQNVACLPSKNVIHGAKVASY